MESRLVFDTQRRIWRTAAYFGALASAAALWPASAFARPKAKETSVAATRCHKPSISDFNFKLRNGPGTKYSIGIRFNMHTHNESGYLGVGVNNLPPSTHFVFSDEITYSDRQVAFDYWDRRHPSEYDVLVDLSTDCGDYSGIFVYDMPLDSNDCADVYVIDMHGSGSLAYEADKPGADFTNDLTYNLPKRLKNVQFEPVPFPAAGGARAFLAAKAGLPGPYTTSVKKMEKWLPTELDKIKTACKTAKIAIVGYSQGAQAAADVYQRRRGKNIDALVIFGDPKYNPKDSSDRFGLNEYDSRKRHTKYNGALGRRAAFNRSSVLSYCHRSDPVCQNIGRIAHWWREHSNYDDQFFSEPSKAGKHIANLLRR